MAKDGNPLFSVIIPTKDRADYLHHTLRTCTLQDYENFEVIVSDDGSEDHTRDIVMEAARKDPRIRYVSPGRCVGMRDNFEFALDQVKPGFIMALGGDDGLLPYGIQGMRDVLLDTGLDMLAWPAPVFSYAKAKMETGQLVIYRQSESRIIRSKTFLENQAKRLHYVDDPESPMFYVKGVTTTRLVEKVRSRSSDGRFYACSTPDGYSGIVLAGEVENYAFSGIPFSIFGTSPTSQGLGYLASDDQAKARSEAFFRNVSEIPMHPDLASQPYSPLITVMTADYLLTARDLPGWPGRFPAIDYRVLLLKSLDELAHGLYGEDRLARELGILERIAEHQGLGTFFRDRFSKARRYAKKRPYEGNGISPNFLCLDSSKYEIHNVFDAAFVAHYLKQITSRTSVKDIWTMFANSVGYRLRSLRKGELFSTFRESQRTGSSRKSGGPDSQE